MNPNSLDLLIVAAVLFVLGWANLHRLADKRELTDAEIDARDRHPAKGCNVFGRVSDTEDRL